MGIMGNLRNRAGLVIFVIGLAIVAFLLGDVVRSGSPFWMQKQNEVGSVNGNAIEYQQFNALVEQTASQFQQQMGGAETPQMKMYAVQQVWNQFLSKELLNSEIEKIGFTVGKQELNDLVTGPNPAPQIMQTFVNPQTGQFDRAYLTQVIEESKNGNPQLQSQWEALLVNVQEQRLAEKYANLLSASIYVTALEAQDEYTAKNKLANFDYTLLDYSSINDADVKLTDADYKEYYDKHKNSFKNQEETRAIQFVLVDARPTDKDKNATLVNIQSVKEEFAASATDSLFAVSHSDTKYPVAYYKKGQLSPALDSVIFTAATGTIVGPFESNNAFEIAKVINSKFSPDSVQVSHIVLNPAAEGGVPQAIAKADSIKGLLQKGGSFAALAVEFSQDPNSKANAGEMGTFVRGQLSQLGEPFEDAVFNAKTGDIIVKESQMGVHILKIGKQVGNSKIVKVAIIDKVINSGKETTDAAFTKANTFFSEANADNFAELAKKDNLDLQTASRVQALDNSINGVEVPRELVRWIFETDKNTVTDKVFETEDNFIIAKVTAINPKGIQPLEAVKSEITAGVMSLVKSRMLKEKMNNALNGSTTIQQVAQKIGKNAIPVENIVLANPVIPGVALESAVIGTVFGLQPNKPSKAIDGTQGVYVVQVNSFVNPKELVETERKNQQKQMLQAKQQRAWGSVFQALQNSSDIVDNRIRFY